MQRLSPRSRPEEYFVQFSRYLKKRCTQSYRDLYGDAMLVPIRIGTKMADQKMADVTQRKHLLLSFATKA